MVAVISADVVRSTSMRTEDLMKLRGELMGFFEDMERNYPGFWARIVKGDGIECYVPEYKYSLRIALLLKLLLKAFAGRTECSKMTEKYGIRFSIGISDIEYSSKVDDMINGDAIYMAGRNLDIISRKDDSFSVIEIDKINCSIGAMLNSFVGLLSNLVDSYSAKQAEVVFRKLRGLKEFEISEILGLSQPAVNARSSKAQWNLLSTAVEDFEKLEI